MVFTIVSFITEDKNNPNLRIELSNRDATLFVCSDSFETFLALINAVVQEINPSREHENNSIEHNTQNREI